jgi:uncharacterized protein (TIGR04255 family)
VVRKRQLARPPIKEALIDLQFEKQMPEQFAEQPGAISLLGFPKKSPIRFQEFSIQLAAETPPTSASDGLFGWRFESEDGGQILQLRRNGMGFSIVREYQNWNHIKSLAQQFWAGIPRKSWSGSREPLGDTLHQDRSSHNGSTI